MTRLGDRVRRVRNLGATPAEREAAYPGDDLVPEPAAATTLAVTVAAPAHVVWRWLVQIGQDRGGMYSYDRLENLFGLGIHSADHVVEEWQHLAEGDRVVVVPPGKLGMPDGYSFPVSLVVPDRCLVLRQCPPEHPWNAVWTFLIEPAGPDACRLISHSRNQRLPGLGGRVMAVMGLVMEPVTLLMTRKMLHGIGERAEREVLAGVPLPAPA